MLLYIWGFTSFTPVHYNVETTYDRQLSEGLALDLKDRCLVMRIHIDSSPEYFKWRSMSCRYLHSSSCNSYSLGGKEQCLENGKFWDKLNE